jgi:hypothetical protein
MKTNPRMRRYGLRLAIATLVAAPSVANAQSPESWKDHAYSASLSDSSPSDLVVDESIDATTVSQAAATTASYAAAAPAAKPAGDKAKKKKEELEKAMKEAYKPVWYNNSFKYLDDPAYKGPSFFGDSLKGMADGTLDVGGELRSRYHHEEGHRGLGLTGRDDQFWLTRLRSFANWRITEDVRFFGEYIYADSAGETFAPRAIEENRGDAQNLFVDAKLLDDDIKVLARVGRQELLYGNQRLISPLDWANTRRTFDGALLKLSGDKTDLDLFYTNPVNRVPATAGSNDWDSADDNQHFYGAYLTSKAFDIGTTELYYIGYDNENLNANFSSHTVGSRINGGESILYEFEGGSQFGDAFNGSDIGAGFVVGGLGRKIEAFGDWKPTVWGYWDWASGASQSPFAFGDTGFNHLFPLGHKYYGFMDLFGRRNMHDFNTTFTAPLGKKVDLLLWYHYFLLDRQTTVYNINDTPFSNQLAASKDVGSEIDMLLTFKLNPRHNIVVGYSYFDAGDYYKLTPGLPSRDNAQFFYSQFTKFF